MDLIPIVNIPTWILAHAAFLGVFGLRLIFRRPAKPDPEAETSAMFGITAMAISLGYLTTSYMPISENQFLHASVPVRMILAGLAGLRLLTVNNISKEGRNQMLFVLLYDGIGGLVCGWQLGRFNGRVPGY
jgi:hypothetical protein